MPTQPPIQLEISNDGGKTWKSFGVNYGYANAAAELAMTCGGNADAIARVLEQGMRYHGTSLATHRRVRAFVVKADR